MMEAMNSGIGTSRGPLAAVKRGLAWYWSRVKPSSSNCQWCGTVVSTGNPDHPFCSESCVAANWQDEQW